jgi:MYXO-CTERM domain-containing protein
VNNAGGSSGNLGDDNVTVNNSGTLGGNSTIQINARVTVNAGGNLAPGNGGNNTAVFTVNALTLQPASNFRIDINGIAPGFGYDQLIVTPGGGPRGAIITNSNLLVHVGTTLAVGQTFDILHHGGGFTGQFAQGSSVVGDNGTVFSVSYSGNDIILTVTGTAPVPEPSTWMGGALALAGLAFTQRRRLRKLIAFSR